MKSDDSSEKDVEVSRELTLSFDVDEQVVEAKAEKRLELVPEAKTTP